MNSYIASLIRENSASKIVIVRDDAAAHLDRKQDLSQDELSDDKDWHRPSSFKNTAEVNPAPVIPARKESNESLRSLSILLEEDGRPCDTSNSHKKQVAFRPISSEEFRAPCEARDDTCQHKRKKKVKQRNSWNGTGLSPMNSFNEIWNDGNIPPTLPRRKKSDDNLNKRSKERKSSACFYRRRSSMDNALMLPSSQAKGSHFQRRGSLDNSILMVVEQTKFHFQRQESLENTSLLVPKTVPISQPRSRFQRRSSLDNAMVSSKNQALLRSNRRTSMDNLRYVDQLPERQLSRRSSLGEVQHFQHHGKEGNRSMEALPATNAVPGLSEAQQNSLKQRLLSTLNSSEWQSKMKVRSDRFNVSSMNDAGGCSEIEPADRLSLLPTAA